MNHEELLAKIDNVGHSVEYGHGIETSRIVKELSALRAVVELHKPIWDNQPMSKCQCSADMAWPCSTIQAIIKELN